MLPFCYGKHGYWNKSTLIRRQDQHASRIDLRNIILLTLTQLSICLNPVEESVFRIAPSFIDCICDVGNTREKACLIISLLKLAVMLCFPPSNAECIDLNP